MKTLMLAILVFVSFTAFSQENSSNAKQVVSLKLMDIAVVAKISATTLTNAPLQIQSASKWITNTQQIDNIAADTNSTKISEYIQAPEDGILASATVYTVSKL